MKKVIALVVAVMMTVSMTACSADKGKIVIGGLAPLTGDVAVYGTSVKNAATMAFDEINAAGGVLGKQIKYEVYDEKGDPAEAVNAYNRLLDKKIVALLGDVTSKPSIAVAELAAKDGVPMLTPTASALDVTTYGKNIFRVCYTDPFQGSTMATFASQKLKAKKVAIIYNTSDDYSQGLMTAFSNKAKELGMTITNTEGYGNDDKDFKAQLTNIQKNAPDALFVPEYYAKDALIAAQAREIGLNIPLLGADGWDGVVDAVDAKNRTVLNNCYFSNHYSAEDTDSKVVNFVKNYKEKYGETPNALAALAYDAAYILTDAIKTAGSTDKAAIVSALAKTNYSGVSGKVTYGNNGDPIKGVTIIRIVDGAYKFFDKVEP